jgi:hypothetical protein
MFLSVAPSSFLNRTIQRQCKIVRWNVLCSFNLLGSRRAFVEGPSSPPQTLCYEIGEDVDFGDPKYSVMSHSYAYHLTRITRKGLKRLCRQRGLDDKGKKMDLVRKLVDQDVDFKHVFAQVMDLRDPDYLKDVQVKHLREMCEEDSLKSTGTKKELIQRISNLYAVWPEPVIPDDITILDEELEMSPAELTVNDDLYKSPTRKRSSKRKADPPDILDCSGCQTSFQSQDLLIFHWLTQTDCFGKLEDMHKNLIEQRRIQRQSILLQRQLDYYRNNHATDTNGIVPREDHAPKRLRFPVGVTPCYCAVYYEYYILQASLFRLKDMCRERNLSAIGDADKLRQRLLDADIVPDGSGHDYGMDVDENDEKKAVPVTRKSRVTELMAQEILHRNLSSNSWRNPLLSSSTSCPACMECMGSRTGLLNHIFNKKSCFYKLDPFLLNRLDNELLMLEQSDTNDRERIFGLFDPERCDSMAIFTTKCPVCFELFSTRHEMLQHIWKTDSCKGGVKHIELSSEMELELGRGNESLSVG